MKFDIGRRCGHLARVKVYQGGAYYPKEGKVKPYDEKQQKFYQALVLFHESQKLCPVCGAQARREAAK